MKHQLLLKYTANSSHFVTEISHEIVLHKTVLTLTQSSNLNALAPVFVFWICRT